MQLFEEFSRAAIQAGATVLRVPRSAERIAAAVERAAPDARRIAIAAPEDLPAGLFLECAKLPGVFTGRTKSELAAADVGITEAFAGVARTGSICITADHQDLGYISLLSKTHVAILAEETIVARPADLFRSDCLGGRGLQRNFVFVTGPSATADMGPLVRGVHGPHHLHIIVLEAV